MQCYSRSKFYNQVNANYDLVNSFIDQESAKNCDYSEYRKITSGMKNVTLQLVDSYFNCWERDCQPAIMAAFQKYVDLIVSTFVPFLLCSFVNFEPHCAENIKHATYFSAENILTTLLDCAALKKSSCQRPDFRLFLQELWSKPAADCNCVKIVNFKSLYTYRN